MESRRFPQLLLFSEVANGNGLDDFQIRASKN